MNDYKFSTVLKDITLFMITLSFFMLFITLSVDAEDKSEKVERMAWWRDARFGMFIHWGLYAIPAGEWDGETNHAEWIRTTAQIPIDVYDQFVDQFNPINFNAEEWVQVAKDAGMKYIVITSKHHDGFCLFDSKYTNFDVISTPCKRDILKELAEACRKYNIKICWYHSIMDWHHPDYLPRREWEINRPKEGADFNRYVQHMKNQLRELIQNYGEIGVLWFDGEWESTWSSEYGRDLYEYVKNLQPGIIINNRVGVGRTGMEGLTKEGEFAGDFGTPEQQIPSTGLPGIDWETCMTMNDHWGWNKNDHNWKSSRDLIQKLADIASKGGNFLLNVGPRDDGTFPQSSLGRLRDMGRWMNINGEAIYNTKASPFKYLSWGRCTQKIIIGGTRLYLHVFEWPNDGKLVVPGIFNTAQGAFSLSDPDKRPLHIKRKDDALVVSVSKDAPDSINSVIVMDIIGRPDVNAPPVISAPADIFIREMDITLSSDRDSVEVRYTLNGADPDILSLISDGSVQINQTTSINARCYRNGKPVSPTVQKTFTKVKPVKAVQVDKTVQGVLYDYYEGKWDSLPDFEQLKSIKNGSLPNFYFAPGYQTDYFGFRYSGFIQIPEDGVYFFYTDSDDGNQLYIGDLLIVNNDGLHGMEEVEGVIALEAGFHPIRLLFFEKTGGEGLRVFIKGPGIKKMRLADYMLFYEK